MSATISPDGQYRYNLVRAVGPFAKEWGNAATNRSQRVTFVMLNPSTADAEQDDPTIRRCMGYARRWGFETLVVVNLYALRSTDPKALKKHPDPIGPQNEVNLRDACKLSGLVVCGWGANVDPVEAERFSKAARRWGVELYALAVTRAGQPRHPLYLPGRARPTRWGVE